MQVQLKEHCATGYEPSRLMMEDIDSGPSTEVGSDDSDSDCSDDDADLHSVQFSIDDTMLLFDWDDTILPSTWLREQGLRLDDESRPTLEQQAKLDSLALHAADTLQAAHRCGKVVLVTNASRGWIEGSCQKFMPGLYPLLDGIKRVSARSMYEQHGVASPFEWKFLAFQDEILLFYDHVPSNRQKNIISFGDSAHEREALIRVTEDFTACLTKSVKLVEMPDVDQLIKEHELIGGCFKHIVQHGGSLDFCIRC